jgi:hypothetical protein
MFIPLNHDGVKFITSALQGISVEDELNIKSNNQENIVRTINKTKRQKPNESIFDMKSISEGYLGLT